MQFLSDQETMAFVRPLSIFVGFNGGLRHPMDFIKIHDFHLLHRIKIKINGDSKDILRSCLAVQTDIDESESISCGKFICSPG